MLVSNISEQSCFYFFLDTIFILSDHPLGPAKMKEFSEVPAFDLKTLQFFDKLFHSKLKQLIFLNKEERVTIDDLSKLCIRAADALEELLVDEKEALIELCPDWSTPRYGLIAELRKAAE